MDIVDLLIITVVALGCLAYANASQAIAIKKQQKTIDRLSGTLEDIIKEALHGEQNNTKE